MSDGLRFEIRDGIARIRFERPQVLNALDVPTADALLDACRAIEAQRGVRAVVLSGAGRAFMAGGDISTFLADQANAANAVRRLIDPLHAALAILAAVDAPVIASVHGAVAGAGMSVALAADLALAADDARFTFAYSKIGASGDGSITWSLPRVVGLRRAMEIALLSETLDAQQALAWGLVNRVVPAASLVAETEALAQRLANGPTLAYGRIKRLLRTSFERDFVMQMAEEREAFAAGTATADFIEGVTAFVGKRAPKFEGK
ncbi:MAG TPA: enoyl-CoA hydratase-related protein [Burkholderiaceae bacterium]|jgi:2-(1,2-epoxy-1,2-dihydrophenyl)acetyl-CoA isomerase|nr:enoyl-CoA hydratase-related protein [Burkholderiaceae bacterium]